MNKDYYSELQIIINQQSILAQKVGILLAINTIFITSIISISAIFSWWIVFSLIPCILSLIINVYILFPKFKIGEKSKYFYDFANMKENDIKDYILNENNILNQIKLNSKILKRKYTLYKHSLSICFFMIPYIFFIIQKYEK